MLTNFAAYYILKEEAMEIEGSTVCNIDVKQELDEEVHTVIAKNYLREELNSLINPLKEEVTIDINTSCLIEKCSASIKRKCNSYKVNQLHTGNKLKYLNKKKKKRMKSWGPLFNGKIIKKKDCFNGINMCTFCGNLYTKQVEYFRHFSIKHCLKQKKLYRTEFNKKEIEYYESRVVKDEIEIVECVLKEELPDTHSHLSTTTNNLKPCSDTENKSFKCEICLKSFSRKKYLQAHSRRHSEVKPFNCDICSKSYMKRGDLNAHLRSHTGEKPFKCDVCLKSYTQKSHLNAHLRGHSGVKQFKCDICSKYFLNKSNLKRHLSSHTDEKPFKCDICIKSFTQKSDLNTHLRYHTGEKPFKCHICLKSFSHKSYLNQHIRNHNGEKPFKCDICPKSFSYSTNLIRHSHCHTEKKPFK